MTNKLFKKIVFGAAVIAPSLFGGARAYAQSKQPELIATLALPFSYESERTEQENNGKLFFYNFLSDGTAYQIDKPTVKFAQRWFWDVDGNGKFGDAEQEAIKEGKLVYLSNTFNEKANAEQMKFLQGFNKNYSTTKTVTGKTWGVTGLDDADANGDGEVTSEEINKYYGLDKKIAEAKLLEETKSLEKEVSKEQTLPKEKVNPTYSLVTGANVNSKFDKYGASIGLRVNPFRNENIGLGLNADVGFGLDKKVDSYKDVVTSKLSVAGSKTNTNNSSIGISAELQLYNLIFGAGLDYSNWITNTNAQIIKEGIVTKSNKDSITENNLFWKGHLGLEFQPKENWRIGAIVGYQEKDGIQFGIRNNIKLNNRK